MNPKHPWATLGTFWLYSRVTDIHFEGYLFPYTAFPPNAHLIASSEGENYVIYRRDRGAYDTSGMSAFHVICQIGMT